MNSSANGTILRFNPSAAIPAHPEPSKADPTIFVYIMASGKGGELAVSMAQDIAGRVANQKRDLHPRDYTSVNGIHTLVLIEEFDDPCAAMDRYSRLREMDKVTLSRIVDGKNPEWQDLFPPISARQCASRPKFALKTKRGPKL